MEREKPKVRTCRDLIVYQLSYRLAMELFAVTKRFPSDEKFSLTDQIRRAARSIPANITEGWAKRKYENVFIRHLVDASGSCEELKTWLDFARDCQYLDLKSYEDLSGKYCEVGAMLNSLIKKWKKF
jgi:four helix bundle protein